MSGPSRASGLGGKGIPGPTVGARPVLGRRERPGRRLKIAVVGTGISGLVSLRILARDHDVVAYEQPNRCGGHSHTAHIEVAGKRLSVDTGFIVYNPKTYPNFVRLLGELGVSSQPSDMSFGVSCPRTGLEYASSSAGLFAQRRNALRPSFWKMLADIRRFYREASSVLDGAHEGVTLGGYLERRSYGDYFVEQHLIPMASAVWSTAASRVREIPLCYLLRFFDNHGFLTLGHRPQWLTVVGGSGSYVRRIVEPHRHQLRMRSRVVAVQRVHGGVRVSTESDTEDFDRVVLATHADQALRVLVDPTEEERGILGAFRYETNEVTLHTDPVVLPRRRRAWASWNYRVAADGRGASLTYLMNRLQRLNCREPVCVSLNLRDEIASSKCLGRYTYQHPAYDLSSVSAQRRLDEINGVDRIYYCGAHWGYGFHEDGVNSALRVAEHFGKGL